MTSQLIAKLEEQLGGEIDLDSIIDVKPMTCGLRDESWYIFRTANDGRWHTYSDAVDQLAHHADEAEARAYWEEAAEAE